MKKKRLILYFLASVLILGPFSAFGLDCKAHLGLRAALQKPLPKFFSQKRAGFDDELAQKLRGLYEENRDRKIAEQTPGFLDWAVGRVESTGLNFKTDYFLGDGRDAVVFKGFIHIDEIYPVSFKVYHDPEAAFYEVELMREKAKKNQRVARILWHFEKEGVVVMNHFEGIKMQKVKDRYDVLGEEDYKLINRWYWARRRLADFNTMARFDDNVLMDIATGQMIQVDSR